MRCVISMLLCRVLFCAVFRVRGFPAQHFFCTQLVSDFTLLIDASSESDCHLALVFVRVIITWRFALGSDENWPVECVIIPDINLFM